MFTLYLEESRKPCSADNNLLVICAFEEDIRTLDF